MRHLLSEGRQDGRFEQRPPASTAAGTWTEAFTAATGAAAAPLFTSSHQRGSLSQLEA